ncbi:MAG: bifunctional oligoribonuclease/PAP phosphatase NrnA [Corallococcus sp.]|nr:bifunctional oligoribonuclease/PAP phosphatase NrnA [Corallococcus sp.]
MKLCQKTTIEQSAKILENASRIAIFAHTRPDGDTIGASLALYLSMKKLGKIAEVFCDTMLSDVFFEFEHCNCIRSDIDETYDLYVAIDCSDINRLGKFSYLFASTRNTLSIDHHCGELFSKYNCVYAAPSTCQIVGGILNALNIKCNKDIATFLYMGLCTDTGNFGNSSTNRDCFEFAAQLVDCGADILKVSYVFFQRISFAKTKLIGRCINNIRMYYNDKLSIIFALSNDFDEFGLSPIGNTEGLVQYALNIDSVIVGVAISQHSEHSYKISMRGKNFDVRKICEEFGGGGHKFAAGCMISGFFEDVIEKIVRTVGFYL